VMWRKVWPGWLSDCEMFSIWEDYIVRRFQFIPLFFADGCPCAAVITNRK
jgi:hypothetical protein